MKTGSVRPDTGKFDSLTTLRFFGAVYIVICHWLLLGVTIVTPRHAIFWRAYKFGGSCVSGFFILSGFILAVVYFRNPEPLNKRRFYVARFARIYPIFLVTLILDTPWFFMSRVGSLGVKGALLKTGVTFGSCLLMLQAWAERFWGMDFPNWSLSVETFCYLLFPFAGYLLWKLRGAWIWFFIVLLYVGGQALVACAVPAATPHRGNEMTALYWPPLHASSFLLGVLVAKLYTLSEHKTSGRGVKSWMAYAAFALSAAIYIGLIVVVPTGVADSLVGTALIRDGVMAPVFCLLIWALVSSKSVVSKLLSTPCLVLLGEASYALYLIHLPVFHLLHPVLVRLLPHHLSWLEFRLVYACGFLLYFAICVSLSMASFRWLETPSRKWLNKRLGTSRRKAIELLPSAAIEYRGAD